MVCWKIKLKTKRRKENNMGFDLTGLNPNLVRPEPELPPFPERTSEDWELYTEWQEENCGTYFRNNVWFWRPLWNFVCGCC